MKGFYEGGVDIALPCLQTCVSCVNGNTCLTCNESLFRFFNEGSRQCDCSKGYT